MIAAVVGIAECVAGPASVGGAATRRLVEALERGLGGGGGGVGHLSCTHTVGARARVKGGRGRGKLSAIF
jgi:hypothetical protein